MDRKIVIATRGSELALIQSNSVKTWIEAKNLGFVVELNIIKTTGDKILDSPLSQVGEKGLFVKEIEESLLKEESDLAVHSMKDVPTTLPEGLYISAIGEREDPRDVLISSRFDSIKSLPSDAKIATSSLRRRVQFLHHFPNFIIKDIRGNLNTRVKKLGTEDLDGIILAAAGVKRMGWDHKITEVIPISLCIPAVGQGAIGIESRIEDKTINDLIKDFNHIETRQCLMAERALMRELEGGCQVPIGAYAWLEGDQFKLKAMICSLDGKEMIYEDITLKAKDIANYEDIGIKLAHKLLEKGAKRILDNVRLAL